MIAFNENPQIKEEVLRTKTIYNLSMDDDEQDDDEYNEDDDENEDESDQGEESKAQEKEKPKGPGMNLKEEAKSQHDG